MNRVREKISAIKEDTVSDAIDASVEGTVGRSRFLTSSTNLRSIILPFQLSFSGRDVSWILSTLGVTGEMNYERSFHRNSPAATDVIKEIATSALDKAFRNEIIVTISFKEHLNCEDEILNGKLEWIRKDKLEASHDTIDPLCLTVSYDMGWQR